MGTPIILVWKKETPTALEDEEQVNGASVNERLLEERARALGWAGDHMDGLLKVDMAKLEGDDQGLDRRSLGGLLGILRPGTRTADEEQLGKLEAKLWRRDGEEARE